MSVFLQRVLAFCFRVLTLAVCTCFVTSDQNSLLHLLCALIMWLWWWCVWCQANVIAAFVCGSYHPRLGVADSLEGRGGGVGVGGGGQKGYRLFWCKQLWCVLWLYRQLPDCGIIGLSSGFLLPIHRSLWVHSRLCQHLPSLRVHSLCQHLPSLRVHSRLCQHLPSLRVHSLCQHLPH